MKKCIIKLPLFIPTILVIIGLLIFGGRFVVGGMENQMPFFTGFGLLIIAPALVLLLELILTQVSYSPSIIKIRSKEVQIDRIEDYELIDISIGQRISMSGFFFFWLIPSEKTIALYKDDSGKEKKLTINNKLSNYNEISDLISQAVTSKKSPQRKLKTARELDVSGL